MKPVPSNSVVTIFREIKVLLGDLQGASKRQQQRWFNKGDSPTGETASKVASWIWDVTHNRETHAPTHRWKDVCAAFKQTKPDAPCAKWTKETMAAWFYKLAEKTHEPETEPPPPDALPAEVIAYLGAVVENCQKLKTETILPGRAKPDSKPLELDQVYVDLNIDLRIPERASLAQHLTAERQRRKPVSPELAQREAKTRLVPALEALALHPKLVLLGVAGSGKSTFTSYVALNLAQARRGDTKALQHLGRWWQHGPLLPIRVILREFADSLPAGLATGRAGHLWQFIETELEHCGLAPGTGRIIRTFAYQHGAVFLFDGLDEARDQATRERILEAVAEFMTTAGEQCRFLLTARPYAWEKPARDDAPAQKSPEAVAAMPVSYRLAELEPPQIEAFIDHWFPAVQAAGWLDKKAAADKTANLKDAVQRADLQPLAKNPLLLTLMASLLVGRERLPDDRTKLYHEAVELLLQRWNEPTKMDRGLLDALKIPALTVEQLRGAIERVALAAHAAHTGGKPLADITASDLKKELRPLLGQSDDKAELVLDYIEKRAGLLLSQGARGAERLYTFPHLTFQEFLAGCCLEKRKDFEQETVRLVETGNPDRWREVFRFAARRALAWRAVATADALIHREEVARRPAPLPERDWHRALLAAEQLLEIDAEEFIRDSDLRVVRERVAGWLAALIVQSPLPTLRRAEAGVVLAKLGDPRQGVGLDANGLPDIDWVSLPAGEFTLGETRQKVAVEAFQLSRYPLTVAQYQAFVEHGGYGEPDIKAAKPAWWTDEGWRWRNGQAKVPEYLKNWYKKLSFPILRPEDFDPVFQTPNHPRVGVCWFEAAAFCRWLTQRRRANNPLPPTVEIRLPHENEWEWAARCVPTRDSQGNVTSVAAHNFSFPWGSDDEKDLARRCNCDKTGIWHTSAVGLFPDGKADCGALDMAGNVWEWCQNSYDAEREYRVVRGGAWILVNPVSLRCASRNFVHPGYRNQYIGFRLVVVGGGVSAAG